MSSQHIRQRIQSEFRRQQLMLDKEALALLVDHVEHAPTGIDAVYTVIEKLEADNHSRITGPLVQEALQRLGNVPMGAVLLQTFDCFDLPKVRFDSVRQRFYSVKEPLTLHATAQDRYRMYLDRLLLLYQRLRRDKTFSKPALAEADIDQNATYCQLTDVKAMLGCTGQTRFLLGCISQLQDGTYYLEDMTGSLQLDLAQCQTSSGLYTENCIVIAEGELDHRGIFRAAALGMPPVESREDSRAATKGLQMFGNDNLKASDWMAVEEAEQAAQADRLVVLSDVWLDKPEVLDQLHIVFSGFNGLETVPSAFVLMGNFQSQPAPTASTDYSAIRENFKTLGSIISQYQRLQEESRFIFVPGPGDPGPANVLPRPALPAYFTADLRQLLPTAVFASNPCRMRLYTQEVVLFRSNLQNHMRRLCLIPPTCSSGERVSSADALFEHLCVTVLQQSHLCPVPLENQSVYWHYDHALHLYPAPDLVVLADSAASAQFMFKDTACVNPGSFSKRTFAAYNVYEHEVELSEVPTEEMVVS
ncbi:hypothetical protein ABBQ38_002229 [Trebouxia sp. C0009 RCD-2024]